MLRRRALWLLALAAGACAVSGARAFAQLHLQPLLPLTRGQLQVSLGDPPQWLPVSGQALTLTLFSGRARSRHPADLNAYIALQRFSSRCASTPARAHAHPLHEIADYYAAGNLVSKDHSPFAPTGGAAGGDYAAGIPNVVVHRSGTVRACVWLAATTKQHGLALVQNIPLLNGLFGASVSAIPSAASASGTAYTVDAIDVARNFSYAVVSTQCGTRSSDEHGVGGGSLGTESISYGANDCAGDGSTFSFSAPSGRSLGSLTYTVADAELAPPAVASTGACELDPLTITPLIEANQYVAAVGCSVRRVLVSPFQHGLPRGAVLEAQVDGGLAEVAPRGTAVDLVLNGR